MAVQASDLATLLSVPGAAEGFADPQADPNASLGEFVSTTPLTDNSANALFRDQTGAEGATGLTLYRCLFIANTHATDPAGQARIFWDSQGEGGATVLMGVDPTGAVALDSTAAQAEVVADEFTAPDEVTFVNPSELSPLVLGDIAAEECIAVWFALVLPADAEARQDDDATFRVTVNVEP